MTDTPRRAKHFKEQAPVPAGATGQPAPVMPVENVYAPAAGAYRGAGYVGQDARKTSSRRSHGRGGAGGRRRSNLLSNLLIGLGVVLLLVAGGIWGVAQFNYHAQAVNNEKLAAYVTVSDDPAAPEGPQVDWAGLKAVNPDVVGWVQVPGTTINFPVYQADDNDYYLHHTATGEWSIGGQVFMDYENTAPGMLEQQTLIYGHHLANGDMFTPLENLTDQQVFDQTTTVWYVTEDATFELEPLFYYKVAATDGAARTLSFPSEDDFHNYLAGRLAQATTKSGKADEAVGTVSKVLTLATCDYDNSFGQGNGRGLVVCALKSEVDTQAS